MFRLSKLDSLRETISALHATLCLDEYKEERERRLAKALEDAERQLEPMEQVREGGRGQGITGLMLITVE